MTRRRSARIAIAAITFVAAGWLLGAAHRSGPGRPVTPTSTCRPAPAQAIRAAADVVRDVATGNLAAAGRLVGPALRRALADAVRRNPDGRLRLVEVTVPGSLSCPPAPAEVDVLALLAPPNPPPQRPVAVAWTLRLTDTPGGWRVTGVEP